MSPLRRGLGSAGPAPGRDLDVPIVDPARPATDADLLSLAASHAADAVGSVAQGTGRRWALLHRDEFAEVWAIAWPVGSGLEMHDHDDARAAVRVVAGRLRERYVGAGGDVLLRWLTDAEPVVLPSDHVHEVVNVGSREAVSVHVYSPPHRRVRPHDERLGRPE